MTSVHLYTEISGVAFQLLMTTFYRKRMLQQVRLTQGTLIWDENDQDHKMAVI